MQNSRFGFGYALWAMMSLSILAGCSASGPQADLTLSGSKQKLDFQHKFAVAYFAKNPTGDTDILLVDDGLGQPTKNAEPATQPPISQLVHIRIFWQPIWGIRADHPAATNAAIEWYMVGEKSPQSDLLVYTGSGLVSIDESGDTATASVVTAWMKAATLPGRMVDPLGPSGLKGTITAVYDDARTKSLLDQIKTLNAQMEAATANPPTVGEPKKLSVNP